MITKNQGNPYSNGEWPDGIVAAGKEIKMSGGRKHKLNNLDDPDFDPLDPACTSDPSCWLPASVAAEVQKGFFEKMNMLKYSPRFQDSDRVWVVEDEREIKMWRIRRN